MFASPQNPEDEKGDEHGSTVDKLQHLVPAQLVQEPACRDKGETGTGVSE